MRSVSPGGRSTTAWASSRRQSQLRLKLVYDLQLDREISARGEYELTLESQLRLKLVYDLQLDREISARGEYELTLESQLRQAAR